MIEDCKFKFHVEKTSLATESHSFSTTLPRMFAAKVGISQNSTIYNYVSGNSETLVQVIRQSLS